MDETGDSKIDDADRPLGTTGAPASDEELARRAQQGCSASFEELARRFQVPLLHYLRRWAANEDAEDLLQDTLVRAYRNLAKYHSSWPFATWVFTIARRLSINWYYQKRLACGTMFDQIADHRPQPPELVAQEEQDRRVWQLASLVLTEPQMTATWLHYVEDMPVKQIAKVLGCSQVAAKATLFRARKKLMPVLQSLEANGLAS